MNHLTLVALLGIVAATFSILLWAYWALAFPIIRRQLAFRAEKNSDQLHLLALGGEISPGCELFYRIQTFTREALEATSNENWITFKSVSSDEAKERRVKLHALKVEIDQHHKGIRSLVDDTMHALVSLYIAQRPFAICVVMPLMVGSYFVNRAKRMLNSKELDFAASALAT